MQFVAITCLLWASTVISGVPVGPVVSVGPGGEIVQGVVAAPKAAKAAMPTSGAKMAGSTTAAKPTGGVKKAGPKKMIKEGEDEKKDKRLDKENKYYNVEGRLDTVDSVSTETLMNSIYTKGRERRKMKSVLAGYLMAHLALTAIRSYTVVSPPFNVLFTSIHALLEKLLPNIEDKWVGRQTELQGLVWDYLDRHSITDAPSKIRVYHGTNSVTIPVLKRSRDAPLPEEFRDIGQSSYAMYKNIVF